jgi:hypothetical protein
VVAGLFEPSLTGQHPRGSAQRARPLDEAAGGRQRTFGHSEHFDRRNRTESESRSLPLTEPSCECGVAGSLGQLRPADDRSATFLGPHRVPADREGDELEPGAGELVARRLQLAAHLLDLLPGAFTVVFPLGEGEPDPNDVGEEAKSWLRRSFELGDRPPHLVNVAGLRQRPLQFAEDHEARLVGLGQERGGSCEKAA